jgi:serine phosphatase RsbU (regulator of sigma subunit)
MQGFGFFHRVEGYQTYTAGQIIFEEGESGSTMYVVIEGEINVTVQGRQIDHLTVGDIFGEMALVDDRPRSATATAVTNCKLLPVDHTRFSRLVQQYPDFALQVMAIMSRRMRRLMEEEVKRQRLEEELAIGRQIQLSLLPESCPRIPGWEITAAYRAARQVGGDLYDFIPAPDNPHILNIVIADVTGKGVPAALFMAFGRTVIRSESRNGRGPAATLRRTNQFIVQDIRSRLFLSAFYASLNTQNGRLRYANGGHDLPLWWRAATGEVQPLVAPGFLLGAFADIEPQEQVINLAPGDCLVFYTDGVTEARNADDELFAEEQLMQVVAAYASGEAERLLQAIVTAVESFTGATPQSDDYTIVVVKRHP